MFRWLKDKFTTKKVKPMQQFSEENLKQLIDRKDFLEYTMRNAQGYARTIKNPQGRNQLAGEAIQYAKHVEEELNALRIQIRALDIFLNQ